jgi:hypothetical protein
MAFPNGVWESEVNDAQRQIESDFVTFHLLPKLRVGRKLDPKLCFGDLMVVPYLKLFRFETEFQPQCLSQTELGKEGGI